MTLVLLHEDTELLDTDFCARVRTALGGPSVAIVGAIGASGVCSLRWGEGCRRPAHDSVAMGRRVTVADLNVFHHTKGGYGDDASFAAADAAFRAKWGEQQVDQELGIAAHAVAHRG